MKRINDISEELKSMGSNLADMSRAMPYSVPEDYFENFAGETFDLVKELNQAESVPSWGKTLPYKVPVNYFEGLTSEIVAAAKAENITVSKETPFKAPSGYFESLPEQILQLAKSGDRGRVASKIIPLRRSFFLRSIRWAAAAVVVLGIGLGSLRMYNRTPANNPEQMLASVSGNEIHDYLQHTYRLDVDKIVNSDVNNMEVDNKDIIRYLDETGWE